MFGSTVNSGFGGFGGGSNALAPALTPAWGSAAVNMNQNPAALANEWLGDGKGTSEHDFKQTYSKETTGPYLNVYLQSIMVQPEYKKFCHEELRMQDYLQGRVFGENPLANKPQPNAGTRAHPFVEIREKDHITNSYISYQTISLMPQYKGNSVEELRMEDYRQGLIFAGDNPSVFGSLSSSFGTSVFGSSSSSTPFAASSAPGFGTQASAPSGFGSTSAFGSSTFPTSSSGFGAKPTAGFGSNLAATSGFGAQSKPGFGSNPFGSTSSAPGGFGIQNSSTPFGGSTLQPSSGFGTFGAQSSGTSSGASLGTGFGSGFGTGTGFGTGATSGFGAGSGFGTGTGSSMKSGTGFGTGINFGTATSSGFGVGAGFGTTTSSGFGTGAGFGAGTATSFGAGAFGANQTSSSVFGAKPLTGFMTSQPTNSFGSFGSAANSFAGFSNSQSNMLAPVAPSQPPKPSAADLNPWGNIVLFDELKKSEPTISSVTEAAKPLPVEDNQPKTNSEEEDYIIDLDDFFITDLKLIEHTQSLDDPIPFFATQYFSAFDYASLQGFEAAPFSAPPLRYDVPLRQASTFSEDYSVPPLLTTISSVCPKPDSDP